MTMIATTSFCILHFLEVGIATADAHLIAGSVSGDANAPGSALRRIYRCLSWEIVTRGASLITTAVTTVITARRHPKFVADA